MYNVIVALKNKTKIEVLCDDCYFKNDILIITLNGVSIFMIPRENILYINTSLKK